MTPNARKILNLAMRGLLTVSLHYPYRGSGHCTKLFMSPEPFSQRVAARLFNKNIIQTDGLIKGDTSIMGTYKVRVNPLYEDKPVKSETI